MKNIYKYWHYTLEKVEEYININKQKPKDTNNLGSWLYRQLYNYNNNLQIMKNIEIKNKFENFINKYKQYL